MARDGGGEERDVGEEALLGSVEEGAVGERCRAEGGGVAVEVVDDLVVYLWG